MHEAADDLLSDLSGLFAGETDPIANAANAAAAIWQHVPDINWAGFYFLKGEDLVLGPFQGRPACVRIPLGRGVCGTAARRRATVVVPDVHAFPGHIACDAASRSEIVVPLLRADALLGVLDIDSPRPDRFGEAERLLFEAVARLWTASLGA
ncbi:GAF domain-containing protein [Rhodovastum atsumiense]|uniref:GAF domain-containing protein n=1 Tax=Rhodovastum atsumiense TaxID=504468 RepID=A0A5M6IYA4_9PROT|nr:GAF domain-containing protein [Rhodovastum atsumiense]KAA5613302.1 GAF domain-containing protein [Rhodovastum atsumiense]